MADTDTVELEQPVAEATELEQAPDPETSDDPAEHPPEDEITIQIGDEEPEQQERAPEWVRELRKSHRELQRQNRELQAKLQTAAPVQQAATLGPKPTLEAADYDTTRYEQQLEAWYARKREVDAQERQAREAQENHTRAWQEKLEGYARAKTELKVKDYDDAEAIVQQSLNTVQQGVILQGAENPALVVYALGRNPKKAKELGAIQDPVKFAFAVAKLEKDMKVTNRKPPAPESIIRSGAPASANDSTLERLRAEAERTGNYSKVVQYKQQLKAKRR